MGSVKLSPQQVEQLVKEHNQSRDTVVSEQNKVQATVETAVGGNQGALFKALNDANQEWQQRCKSITEDLQAMTDQIKSTSAATTDQDDQSASSVKGVASNIGDPGALG